MFPASVNNGNDGPHPLDPPLPTLGEGEDLAQNLTKIEDFCQENSPTDNLGEGVGGHSSIPVNESQKLVKSKVVSNIGSLFNLNSSRPTRKE